MRGFEVVVPPWLVVLPLVPQPFENETTLLQVWLYRQPISDLDPHQTHENSRQSQLTASAKGARNDRCRLHLTYNSVITPQGFVKRAGRWHYFGAKCDCETYALTRAFTTSPTFAQVRGLISLSTLRVSSRGLSGG